MLPDLSYYIRAGSNFAKTPHAVLAGMFGRRPQPSVKLRYLVDSEPRIVGIGLAKTQMGMILHNYGLGIARDVFINLAITSHPGRGCVVEFKPSEEKELWFGRLALQREMHAVMRHGFVLPPEQYVIPLALEISLRNPIEREFSFEGICGSADGEPHRFQFKSEVADIVEATDRFLRTPPDAPDTPMLQKKFNKFFFRAIPNA